MKDHDLEAAGFKLIACTKEGVFLWAETPVLPGTTLHSREAVIEQIKSRMPSPPSPPAPRPTCGSCPHWEYVRDKPAGASTIRYGECYCLPPSTGKRVEDWEIPEVPDTFSCGQHPDMENWIKTEWPKILKSLHKETEPNA